MSPIRLDCFLEIQTENFYQVPKLINTTTITATTPPRPPPTTTTWDHGWVPYEGPRENPRSLASPKAEKLDFDFFMDRGRDKFMVNFE